MRQTMRLKVTADHLRRDAYVYVRQAAVQQDSVSTESTRRQYALRETAVALGWPIERVQVIDSDMGKSGMSADREGFRRLAAEIGEGRAGIVLAIDVSRLTRNASDWHRLLEVCSRTDTLLLDQNGIYSPHDLHEQLVLDGDLVPA